MTHPSPEELNMWLDGQGNIRLEGAIPNLDAAGDTAPQVYTAAPCEGEGRQYTVVLSLGKARGEGVVSDGVIDLANDMLGVILQFAHNCQ